MSDQIVEQYEAFPYPKRDPADEAKRLIEGSPSHLLEINHYIFGGARDFREPIRVLVAGGGTGDATIMLGQHLSDRGCPAEIVYLDLSTASRAVAEARARHRGLKNIRFLTASLLDLPKLNLGKFDYIDCCGVLHHLDDPAEGLRALMSVLSPTGGMGIMVYGLYGRTGVYQAQSMLRMLIEAGGLAGATPGTKLVIAQRLLGQLPPTNWLHRNVAINDHLSGGDAGIYDLLLHSCDRAYDVPSLAALVTGAGLEFTALLDPWRYDPASYITDPELLATIAQLDPIAQAGFAELLVGNLKCHIAYVVPRGRALAAIAKPTDVTMIPILRPGSGDWARQIGDRRSVKANVDGYEARIPIPLHAGAVMALVDGQRSINRIQQDLAATDISFADQLVFKAAFEDAYTTFHRLNLLFLESSSAIHDA